MLKDNFYFILNVIRINTFNNHLIIQIYFLGYVLLCLNIRQFLLSIKHFKF